MKLSHPAPGQELTSPFGPRIHPFTQQPSLHLGIDWGGRFTVLAAGAGRVVEDAYEPTRYGNLIRIEHTPTLRTLYAHGAHRSPLDVGDTVRAGTPIFTSGSTGVSTGDHLHFGVYKLIDGVWVAVDPAPYLSQPPILQGAVMNTWSIILHKSGRNRALYLLGEGRLQLITETTAKELGLKRRTVGDAGMTAIRAQLKG